MLYGTVQPFGVFYTGLQLQSPILFNKGKKVLGEGGSHFTLNIRAGFKTCEHLTSLEARAAFKTWSHTSPWREIRQNFPEIRGCLRPGDNPRVP
jgi:hypothetical protein